MTRPTPTPTKPDDIIDEYLRTHKPVPEELRDPDMPFVYWEEARHRMRAQAMDENLQIRYPELFVNDFFDPEILGCFNDIPDGVLEAFREAMPEEARRPDKFRVGWHPWFKRICLYERRRDRDNTDNVWGIAFIFCGDIDPYKLPADIEAINHDGRYDTFTGQVGEFYAPRNKWDWIELKEIASNHKAWKKGERARRLMQIRAEGRAEAYRRVGDIRHDFLSHYRHLFGAAANERWGCMTGFPIMGLAQNVPTAQERDQARYKVTQEAGYRVVDKTLRPSGVRGQATPAALLARMPEAMRSRLDGGLVDGLMSSGMISDLGTKRPLVEVQKIKVEVSK